MSHFISKSHSPLTVLCAIFGTLAFAGYYSDLLKPYVPAWLAVGIFVLPVLLLLFAEYGEIPDKVVTRAHLSAAALFLILALGMEAGALWGYRPKGLNFYRILAHLSWSFAWAGVIRAAYRRRSIPEETS